MRQTKLTLIVGNRGEIISSRTQSSIGEIGEWITEYYDIELVGEIEKLGFKTYIGNVHENTLEQEVGRMGDIAEKANFKRERLIHPYYEIKIQVPGLK